MQTRLVKAGRLFLSILFLFSGISKLISLPFFDGLVAELLIGKDYYNFPDALFYTQILTRVIIAGELVLGAAVLQETLFKKLVLPVMQGMLLLFTIHLFYEGFRHENGFLDGNCGCFGDVLPMNNLESILKNVAAMLVGFYVWKKHEDRYSMNFKSWVLPVIFGLVSLGTLLLTVKDYGGKEEAEVIPSVEVEPKIEFTSRTKSVSDSLVNQGKFEKALETIQGDSIQALEHADYVKRLEEVVEIQKLK